MTAPNDLMALADRVEGLSGPCRETDIAIALAQPERFFNAGPRYEGEMDDIGTIEADGSRSFPGNAPDMMVPDYTASIDAALGLYVTLPERIPSDPRKATAEALRQRAERV